MFDFNVITGCTIKDLLSSDPRGVIDCVKTAYLNHHDGKTINPDSYFLRFPDRPENRIIALPAAMDAEEKVSGLKWISSFPGNIKQGVPRASAVLILNDHETGYPFACLEASLISAARTAASAVLGAYWLNGQSRQAGSIAFIGAGVIARNIVDMFIADDWHFREILCHDQDPAYAAALRDHIGDRLPGKQRVAADLEQVLHADILVFATSAGTPYVAPSTPLAPGQIVLNISLRDLAPELVLDAWNLFDDVDHCLKANTSPHLAEQLCGDRRFVHGTLAELMLGKIAPDERKPCIYSPFGMGMLDLALGKRLHDEAVANGLAHPITDFFGETKRWS